MRFLPIVGRELRVSARRPRLYWGRFVAGTLAIGLVAWMWLTFGNSVPSDRRAQQLFVALSTLGFLYSLFVGFMLTADVVSEEKRDGTLGLLFLTDLKGYDVVLGKLVASSLYAFYGLMAIFPVMTLPLLLGGVEFAEVGRMALVLLNTLWVSLSVGLFVSSLSKHDRKAQLGAFVLMLALTGLWPLAVRWWYNATQQVAVLSMYAPTPVFSFVHAFDKEFANHPSEFWFSIWVIHALGWLLLVAAAVIMPRVWQDRPAMGAKLRWTQKWRQWRNGSPEKRLRYRRQLLNINPFYWLSSRDRLKPLYLSFFLAACALLWLILYFREGNDMLDQGSFFLTALFLHMVIKIWLCSESGRLFAEDKRSGALELTLSTPLKVREILEGQFLGLLRQFGLAAGIILLADVVMMVLGARLHAHAGDSNWVLMSFAGILVLVMDLFAIPTLGMWLALTSKRASRAALLTGFYILVLPWLILFGFLTFVALVKFTGIDSIQFVVGAYFVISLIVDLLFFLWASGNLTSRFREVVTERFGGSH